MKAWAGLAMAAIGAIGCLASCAAVVGAPTLIYSGEAPAGDATTVTGYLTVRGGYSFLTMTRDVDGPCVGLLPTRTQYADLMQSNQGFVRISGRYEPSGCGGDFVCHDTCGPAVFSRIDTVQKLADRDRR